MLVLPAFSRKTCTYGLSVIMKWRNAWTIFWGLKMSKLIREILQYMWKGLALAARATRALPLESKTKPLEYTYHQYFRKLQALTLFRMGIFTAAYRWGPKKDSLPKIFHTYPTKIKLGTVVPDLKKTQKIYELRDTPLKVFWHQQFFIGNLQILLYQKIQI